MNRETSEPSPYTAEWRANSPSRRLSDTLLLPPARCRIRVFARSAPSPDLVTDCYLALTSRKVDAVVGEEAELRSRSASSIALIVSRIVSPG